MLIEPERVIAEVLGEPAAEMRNPVRADFQCPFIHSTCTKTSHRIAGPFPVCTVFSRPTRANRSVLKPVCVCPKRLYGADLVRDIVEHCWPDGDPPLNPRVAYEVKMASFGNVDMVVADIDRVTGQVRNFVSVELQAVDITGSYEPAYQALTKDDPLVQVSYGFNWKNVQKRFVFQLINKGFYHHIWQTRIVAVVQTPLYERLHSAMQFDELPPDRGGNTVVFMLYDYFPDPNRPGASVLKLDRVVGTSHNSLMTSSLYGQVPPKEEFHQRILSNLS